MKRFPFPLWMVFAVLAAVVLVPGAAAVIVAINEEQRRVRLAAKRAEETAGLMPGLIQALGYVESRWRMGAVNMSGADGARGGSWGPFQLSEQTARGYGYTGPMSEFQKDPDSAALWCATIMLARPGGAPRTIEEAAAWWNAGRTSTVGLPASTANDYIPKARQALAIVQTNPVA
jgi:hypothetical protein